MNTLYTVSRGILIERSDDAFKRKEYVKDLPKIISSNTKILIDSILLNGSLEEFPIATINDDCVQYTISNTLDISISSYKTKQIIPYPINVLDHNNNYLCEWSCQLIQNYFDFYNSLINPQDEDKLENIYIAQGNDISKAITESLGENVIRSKLSASREKIKKSDNITLTLVFIVKI